MNHNVKLLQYRDGTTIDIKLSDENLHVRDNNNEEDDNMQWIIVFMYDCKKCNYCCMQLEP